MAGNIFLEYSHKRSLVNTTGPHIFTRFYNNQLIQSAESQFHSLCYDIVFIPESTPYYLQPLMFEQIISEKF